MSASGVSWETVDMRIPTGQSSSDRAKRDRLFDAMDSAEHGAISLAELYGGIPPLLERKSAMKRAGRVSGYVVPMTDFKPAVRAAFRASRRPASTAGADGNVVRDHDAYVDRSQFQAFLLALRSYLELNVLLGGIDQQQDPEGGRLSWRDCQKAMPLLHRWGLSEEQARQRFPDGEAPSTGFEEFAQWCLAARLGRPRAKVEPKVDAAVGAKAARQSEATDVLRAFRGWDTGGEGTISADQLACVLTALDARLTKDQVLQLLSAADADKDGGIDYRKFTQWVTQCK